MTLTPHLTLTPTLTLALALTLQEMLDKRLLERQARETGICPVREDLYSQGFDELIRQVCVWVGGWVGGWMNVFFHAR